MIWFSKIGFLNRGLLITIYIFIILLTRKGLNRRGSKYAVMILWGMLLLRLLLPYSISIVVMPEQRWLYRLTYPFITVWDFIYHVSNEIGDFFPALHRFVVAGAVGIYILYQVLNTDRVLSRAEEISPSKRMKKYMRRVPCRRKVRLFVNNDLKAPVTYGIFSPKIVLQDRILGDDILLKYVLVHEMTHVAKFDVLWNHLKNLLLCLYWYNPLVWLMSRILNEDLEVLCDKLVVERTGGKEFNKNEYIYVMCNVMMEGIQRHRTPLEGVLGLNPTVERMVTLKKMRKDKIGKVLSLVVAMFLTTAFVYAEKYDPPVVIELEGGGEVEERIVNTDDRTEELVENEYFSLDMEAQALPLAVDIDEKVTLRAFGNKSHTFDMSSYTEGRHTGFTTRISDTSSRGPIEYKVLIEEGDKIIFSKTYYGDVNLRTRSTKVNKDYTVTIINLSNAKLNYNIRLKSYK